MRKRRGGPNRNQTREIIQIEEVGEDEWSYSYERRGVLITVWLPEAASSSRCVGRSSNIGGDNGLCGGDWVRR